MAAPFAVLGKLLFPARMTVALIRSVGIGISHRRVMADLNRFDDRMLRDIGLTRQDVISASAAPLFRDPTVQLVKSASDRRSARRESARERVATAALLSGTR